MPSESTLLRVSVREWPERHTSLGGHDSVRQPIRWHVVCRLGNAQPITERVRHVAVSCFVYIREAGSCDLGSWWFTVFLRHNFDLLLIMAEPTAAAEVPEHVRSRKRVRQPKNWREYVAKMKRNTGQEYVSTAGRVVPARKIGPACSDGCFTKIPLAVRQEVHSDFWKIGNFSLQNAFIQKHVAKMPVKRHRKTKTPQHPGPARAYTLSCMVSCRGTAYPVCRQGFLSILGITKTRLATAQKSVTGGGSPIADKRGCYPHQRVIGDEARQLVIDHVRSFPTVSSHYTRAKSPHRRYLDTRLSVCKMYKMYESWVKREHPDTAVVKESYYRHLFNTEFNLSFKPPATDTCSKCDQLTTSITAARDHGDVDTCQALEQELEKHKDQAARGQSLMKEVAREADDDMRVLCLDLQQTLPCPRLATNVAYYKRKLWVYNLCIYDLKTGKPTFYMWDETTGGRGSSEVATCLRKWIEVEYSKGDFGKLVVFSDNCGGQNKNLNVLLCYLRELHSARLQHIDHFYLIPGHSYMACDRSFGHIEKAIRTEGQVYHFDGYCSVVSNAVHNGYAVVRVNREDFLNFDVLQSYVTHRRPRPPVKFIEARHFAFRLNFREGYLCGMGYEDPLSAVRLMPGSRDYRQAAFNLATVPLPSKYPRPLVLQKPKLDDLRSLLTYIPDGERQFFRDLFTCQDNLQGRGAAQDDNLSDEEVVDDDLLDYDGDTA